MTPLAQEERAHEDSGNCMWSGLCSPISLTV